jgi:uncharacterized membrane protein
MIIEQMFSKSSEISSQKVKDNSSINETAKRSFAKTISWRIIGTLDTVLISWLITGTFSFAISIGAIELFTKIGLYFFHERVWNSVSYGK